MLVVVPVLRYTWGMETVVHNVRDLRDNERSAAEQLVGHSLHENQKLVIQVVNLDLATGRPAHGAAEGKLPEWCNVYEGLTDEEIADLEKTILTRADLSRPSE
jgi:hypothetical protein